MNTLLSSVFVPQFQFTDYNSSYCRWYGPRKSKNKMSEDYSKAGTLPLSEKEQEIVKLSVANVQNGKTEDFNVHTRDEHEREYLM